MNAPTKIATCSYCQARVIMSLTAGSRHELSCSSCGAPLQQTEYLEPPQQAPIVAAHASLFGDVAAADERPRKAASRPKKSAHKDRKKDRKKDKKKRGLRYWIKEAIDEIEDFFD